MLVIAINSIVNVKHWNVYDLSPCLSFSNEFYVASISIKLDKIFVSNHDFQTNKIEQTNKRTEKKQLKKNINRIRRIDAIEPRGHWNINASSMSSSVCRVISVDAWLQS